MSFVNTEHSDHVASTGTSATVGIELASLLANTEKILGSEAFLFNWYEGLDVPQLHPEIRTDTKMVQGMPGWIACLPYRRTTPDLSLHKTRLHLVLSSKEWLEGKVRNPDAHFTVTVVSKQKNKMRFHSMEAGDRGYKCISVCPLSEAVQRWSEVHE